MCGNIIKKLELAIGAVESNMGGTPSPMPAKAPRDGSSNDELQCIKLAHLLYRVKLLQGIPPATAWAEYCVDYDGCYGV